MSVVFTEEEQKVLFEPIVNAFVEKIMPTLVGMATPCDFCKFGERCNGVKVQDVCDHCPALEAEQKVIF